MHSSQSERFDEWCYSLHDCVQSVHVYMLRRIKSVFASREKVINLILESATALALLVKNASASRRFVPSPQLTWWSSLATHHLFGCCEGKDEGRNANVPRWLTMGSFTCSWIKLVGFEVSIRRRCLREITTPNNSSHRQATSDKAPMSLSKGRCTN